MWFNFVRSMAVPGVPAGGRILILVPAPVQVVLHVWLVRDVIVVRGRDRNASATRDRNVDGSGLVMVVLRVRDRMASWMGSAVAGRRMGG